MGKRSLTGKFAIGIFVLGMLFQFGGYGGMGRQLLNM